MTPEHLDEFLRQENDYEKDPSATFNLTAFNEILNHIYYQMQLKIYKQL